MPDICRDVTSKAASWIGCAARKFGGAQPVSMTNDNIRFLNEKHYMVILFYFYFVFFWKFFEISNKKFWNSSLIKMNLKKITIKNFFLLI